MRNFLGDDDVFDPGTVSILMAAFDSAWQSIKNRRARPCRYVVYEDEYEEAIAKGLPLPHYFALMPRVLSREEWIEKYSPKQDGESSDR